MYSKEKKCSKVEKKLGKRKEKKMYCFINCYRDSRGHFNSDYNRHSKINYFILKYFFIFKIKYILNIIK